MSMRHEVIVVGGGQAGLAMGYFLARRGQDFTILEAAHEPAAAWRGRWDSLRLFTSARYDSLPGRPFPGDPNRYPTRDEVVDYLSDYAAHFHLPVELESPVRALRRNDRFLLDVGERSYEADQVVVATGPFQTPRTPSCAGRLGAEVTQLHSSSYRTPDAIAPGRVLVVGGGNSGYQIAADLAGTHEVHLAIGSRQLPLPQRILGRDLFWYLDALGLLRLSKDSRLGRRLAAREDTLIGSSPRLLRRQHAVTPHGRVTDADGRVVRFADGSSVEVDSVIWATGFRLDLSWIELPVLDADGRLIHRRGVSGEPGLYFLGQLWQHTRGSALLGWVRDDAEYLAQQIGDLREGAVRARRPDTSQPPSLSEPGQPRVARRSPKQWTRTTDGAPDMASSQQHFTSDVADSPPAQPTEVVELADGDRFELRIAPVAKRVGGAAVRMLAYNGSIPGPILRVRQGAQVSVDIENQGDMENTVHWHGLRLDNRYDGTHHTQPPIQVGDRFTAVIKCPDPGAYWYHPHVRSDYGIEMGLYGGIIVEPDDPDHWPPVHRELFLTLDDLLLEEGQVAPFSREETTHAAMGRFGNVILVNGETDLALTANRGEVLRVYLLDTANTRVFNVGLPGARMKLVGGDSGHVEHEEWVDEVVLAPSERVVVDVMFETAGEFTLQHRTPDRTYTLATITVADEPAEPSLAEDYARLRSNPDMAAERARIQPYLEAPPDKTLSFLAEMNFPEPEGGTPAVYACPMHPEVVSESLAHCPQCGMKLVAVATVTTYVCPMHLEVVSDEPGHCPKCAMKLLPKVLVDRAADGGGGGGGHEQAGEGDGHQVHDAPGGHDHGMPGEHAAHGPSGGHQSSGGIEWEDDMVEVNRMTTPTNFQWKLVDQDTQAVNAAIDWRFRIGDQVKIRLINEMAGDHPMHHPFHIHGAGRFLVLSRDGVVEPNLVWKDTVLLRTGETVDILLDVTEPGTWMAHCHIAEHHETGMMFNFTVDQ